MPIDAEKHDVWAFYVISCGKLQAILSTTLTYNQRLTKHKEIDEEQSDLFLFEGFWPHSERGLKVGNKPFCFE